jgi:hypothetical protein
MFPVAAAVDQFRDCFRASQQIIRQRVAHARLRFNPSHHGTGWTCALPRFYGRDPARGLGERIGRGTAYMVEGGLRMLRGENLSDVVLIPGIRKPDNFAVRLRASSRSRLRPHGSAESNA